MRANSSLGFLEMDIKAIENNLQSHSQTVNQTYIQTDSKTERQSDSQIGR